MNENILIAMLIGYLAGSIPFGLLITKFAGEGDVRAIGSGNIGATNVLRTGRISLAALTLLADIFKGLLPVVIVNMLFGGFEFGLVAGFAALIGHMFSIWLKFKGGKGVATFIGAAFGFNWLLGIAFIAVWIAIAFAFRYSSLAALVAVSATSLLAVSIADPLVALVVFMMGTLVLMRHRSNIERLITGEEDKIGQKK